MGFNFVNSFAKLHHDLLSVRRRREARQLAHGNQRNRLGCDGPCGRVPAQLAEQKVRQGRNALLVAILLMPARPNFRKSFVTIPACCSNSACRLHWRSEENRTVTVQGPYLVLIPTMLLSAGMLMFFTLGSSMVGDVCDEDDLNTGTRSEGTYYSVFWWFIKMGTAMASVVMGALLVFTAFDEQQNVKVDALVGDIAVMKADADKWQNEELNAELRLSRLNEQLEKAVQHLGDVRGRFQERIETHPDQSEHLGQLIEHADSLRSKLTAMRENSSKVAASPTDLMTQSDDLLVQANLLKQQSPTSLFRLRLFDIGVPLLLEA